MYRTSLKYKRYRKRGETPSLDCQFIENQIDIFHDYNLSSEYLNNHLIDVETKKHFDSNLETLNVSNFTSGTHYGKYSDVQIERDPKIIMKKKLIEKISDKKINYANADYVINTSDQFGKSKKSKTKFIPRELRKEKKINDNNANIRFQTAKTKNCNFLDRKNTSESLLNICNFSNHKLAISQFSGYLEPLSIDTDDENHEKEEFEKWKIREICRLKRDRLDWENNEKDKSEKSSKVEMSESKESQYYRTNPNKKLRSERPKMKFLQKYYHKGAYYQDISDDIFGTVGTDPIYDRNFNEPTEADNFDKTLLPAVMQVKNFGRRGRVKWTHLVCEDTSTLHNTPIHMMTDKHTKINKS